MQHELKGLKMMENEEMETEELEKLAFAFRLGSLVLKTADESIKDDNLLKGQGTFMYEGKQFLVEVSKVEE
ncbi:hypothetical protein [Streptococcus sp.]|uniref:hypothetical protein n=1 Tax=Streptococcus sp. TaxID=1306 RepID=UPI00290846CD|nr:hypothetical protein [Streptococcus sp.]MDU6445340.1 hypothetical protein [Streptococcus sp.]MDU6639101.1 hypothetical protein [Streptococcus sp.]